MERRFNIVLSDDADTNIPWNAVFNEDREMPGHQTKYEHMRDRTYLRPRDLIKFSNCALVRYKERTGKTSETDHPHKIDNIDIHNARVEYSEYFLSEIDDEVHKHFPDYDRHSDVLRALGKWHFEKE
jgi:hypothetical protein